LDWQIWDRVGISASGEIYADVTIPPDSPWFSGHFPAEPILPGIAQLALVLEAIRQATEQNIAVQRLKRIRFRQIIKPGDQLSVVVNATKEKEDIFAFSILRQEEVVCSGTMVCKVSGEGRT
jgi:3-hydroxymyristoyl/3-hydroxydecanoyl-(acyl carrier protein) dehydratase